MEPRKQGRERTGRMSWHNWIGPLLLISLCVALVHSLFVEERRHELKYSELKEFVRSGKVHQLTLGRSEISGELTTPTPLGGRKEVSKFRVPRIGIEQDDSLIVALDNAAIPYTAEEEPNSAKIVFIWLFPMLLLMAFLYFVLFRRLGAGGSAMTFGRSRARLYCQEDLGVSFDDVAGIDEAVEELREVVDFLKRPQKYQAIGGRIPKGVLLVGPPGTGKTLLGKAVAGEADVPFFSLSGSDFVEMFVGVGAARVRDLFAQAEKRAPCIIFIDELDALGKVRGVSVVGGHDEREQTLNQLLVEMDGFESNRGVIIMAATNRPETLDPALLRPGRFDRTVVVDRPDVNGREAILKVHVRTVKVAEDLDLRAIAGLTPGFVGADLANLVNEAALLAARAGESIVGKKHFEEAIERGVAGLKRKQRVMMPEEKQRIAYHECGHAIVAYLLPGSDPVHKISIIPRGIGALGYTLQMPVDDRYLATKAQLENRICTLLGGIVAEELFFPDTSTGAQNDLEQITRIARSMVREFGMSNKLGRVNYSDHAQAAFLAGSLGAGERNYSESTACAIDQEVKSIVDRAGNLVREVLETNRAVLQTMAQQLIEKEVLDAEEFRQVMDAQVPRLVPGTAAFGQQRKLGFAVERQEPAAAPKANEAS